MILLALLLSFAQAQTLAPSASPWTTLERSEIPASGRAGDRLIPLHLVVEIGSAWDRPEVLRQQLAKSSGILGACGVGIGEVTVERVQWDAGLAGRIRTASPYQPPAQLELVANPELVQTRPIVFLFAKGIERTATAYNRRYVDTFKGLFPQANIESLLNVIIMTDHYVTNTFTPAADASYSTFAHELFHVLGNAGHVDVRRNLMSTFETRGMQTGALTTEQCQQMQGFPY